ncbi:hypothetical protein PVAND_016192 [Polypedilum vanderplanki]|uniref:Uncharacterized protein n=1 Tax=Polypedilum vanderplanki TaxID=319348 RepID=A0A9J6BEQ8_POLVA|nr:hypothetical protein PVAND_016192 [Polypedilum vanderplanki]QLB38538.1 transmembrane protein LIL13 [Polypedilum vanderplanki]
MKVRNLFGGDSFLGLFTLDTGGIIIGALGLFCSLISLVANSFFLFSLLFVNDFCPQRYFIEDKDVGYFSKETQQTIKNTVNYAQESIQNLTRQAQGALTNATDKDISCTFVSKIPFFLIFLGMIILSIIGAIAHYRLMKGIEENDHKKTRLARGYYMFYIGLRAILFIVFLIWCFFNGKMLWPAIFSLVLLLIDLYAYSIIDKLRVKYEHTPPVNTAQTTQFVQRTRITA